MKIKYKNNKIIPSNIFTNDELLMNFSKNNVNIIINGIV